MYKVFILLILPLLLFSKFQVTTNFPLETFIVKQIGQSHIRIKEINNLFSTDVIKLEYNQKTKFARVKAYFHFGFESELEYAKQFLEINPNLKVVDMSMGINKDSYNGKVNHYIWLDPLHMRTVAKNVYETLVSLDKFSKDDFEYNYNAFLDKLDELFLKTKKSLDSSELYNIFVYDEDWYYYAKRYRLNLYREEKKVIKSKDYSKVKDYIKKNSIKALLIKPNESYNMARSLAGNDVKMISHDIFDKVYFYNIDQLTKELSAK